MYVMIRRAVPTPKKRRKETLPLNIHHDHTMVVNRRGKGVYTHTFMPATKEPIALVFFVHDYADDSSWFLRDLAVYLCQQGFGVIALDWEGHGRSDGKMIHGLEGKRGGEEDHWEDE